MKLVKFQFCKYLEIFSKINNSSTLPMSKYSVKYIFQYFSKVLFFSLFLSQQEYLIKPNNIRLLATCG